MSKRTVVDMGKNLVPPRPFLTPVSALAVVRERLKRLVGIAPLLTDGFKTIGVSAEEAARAFAEFTRSTGQKMHVRGDIATGCTGNPSCCPACGVEAFLSAPGVQLPRNPQPSREQTRRPPSGKRMLATEET